MCITWIKCTRSGFTVADRETPLLEMTALAAQTGAGDPTLSQPEADIAAAAPLSDLETCVSC
jgi:hypothetical protein